LIRTRKLKPQKGRLPRLAMMVVKVPAMPHAWHHAARLPKLHAAKVQRKNAAESAQNQNARDMVNVRVPAKLNAREPVRENAKARRLKRKSDPTIKVIIKSPDIRAFFCYYLKF
jgi:hypothetical protein